MKEMDLHAFYAGTWRVMSCNNLRVFGRVNVGELGGMHAMISVVGTGRAFGMSRVGTCDYNTVT